MAHKHEFDQERWDRMVETGCDDGSSYKLEQLAKEMHAILREAHGRKKDMAKMCIRVILRGSNVTLSWPKAESNVDKLVAQAQNARNL